MEALSLRSTNLPMKPPSVVQRVKSDSRGKSTQVPNNPDKIDEEWRPANMVREPGSNGDTYLTGKKLGRGGFAVCFEGKSELSRQVYALKVVKSKVEQKKQLEKFRTELQIHAKMHHPSIVEFYRAFAFENYTYVVLELCPNGSLMDMVRSRKSLSLPEVRRIMIQLCGGVKYMHQRWVIHRDLKMGNVFIDGRMNVKIGDFGLAAVVVDEQERRQTMCGTPNYIAPELLARSSTSGHGHEVDTWAMGIICYAMLIGSPPFASKSQTEIYNKLKQLQYEWKEDCQYFIPSQAKALVTLCLNLSPSERPGMDDLVEHEFFKMGVIADELDRSCLKKEPTWLIHADPRGDKVMPGHGISHAAICEACGVGKDPSGGLRPAVGGNVNISAMSEVQLENDKDCAPIVPMPEGVVYKEFAVAKEDWNATKRHPLATTKLRTRKTPASRVATMSMASLSTALLLTEPSRTASKAIPPGYALQGTQGPPQKPPVQSFAAQQRQQALPPKAPGSRVTSIAPRQLCPRAPGTKATSVKSIRQAAPTEDGLAQIEAPTESEQSRHQNVGAKAGMVGSGSPPPRNLLREQPVRAASRVTRSKSTREKPQTTQARDLVQAVSSEEQVAEEEPSRPERTTRYKASVSSQTRVRTRQPLQKKEDERLSTTRSLSTKQPTAICRSGSIDRPLRVIDANDRQSEISIKDGKSLKAETTKVAKRSRCQIPPARVIAPTDDSMLVPGTAASDVMDRLQGLCHSLSPRAAVSRAPVSSDLKYASNVQPVVEKWVDYSEKYGIGYVLSDGTAGLALRSSDDNIYSSSYVVLRSGKAHYQRRVHSKDKEVVPQGAGASPVEFYEGYHSHGIKKMQVPAAYFRFRSEPTGKWKDGRDVLAWLTRESKGEHEAERVRLVGLIDKFGKYMCTINSRSEEEKGGDDSGDMGKLETAPFIRFYQRMGNVGIWGFGDGSLQFNFPDHTKLVVYPSSPSANRGNQSRKKNEENIAAEGGEGGEAEASEWMLDLYHLHPDDATYLSKHGRMMSESSFERRDLLTCPIVDILQLVNQQQQPATTTTKTTTTTMASRQQQRRQQDLKILTTNQIPEKLSWIRAVVGLWIRQGGLGRTTGAGADTTGATGATGTTGRAIGSSDRLAWTGLSDRAVERARLRERERERGVESQVEDGNGDGKGTVKARAGRKSSQPGMAWVCVGREGGDGSG